MSVSSILSYGMQSMQAGMNRSAIAGARIAGFGSSSDNSAMASSMVELSRSAIDAKAAANVIKTGDAMLGTLVNLRA
ncbi:hypothetical protein [Quatrionicoccus australiensis]|uniref:hypothetical protein n=1 Tax=Quatrionicoccus australiensis TaxID=138118 RepID=UPI001CF8F0F3|nr:hypothetical protein [Quatrionicoccus australiensis]UCV15991.1 hypothetical protein KI612_04615 [Quatrionicoccus australiensis]